MALKDEAGLVKKYAMVNVSKYQWVAIGDTIQQCEKNYVSLLNTNGIVSEKVDSYKEKSEVIEVITPVVLEGNTHYYVCLKNDDAIYDVNMNDETLISIIRYKEGDKIKFLYEEGYGLHDVKGIE